MDQECDGSNRTGKKYEKIDYGIQNEVDNANNMVEQEESTGSIPSPLPSCTKPKRLRSKAWDDFIPIFVDGKVMKAECMHCHQVLKKTTSGTSSLLKHQAKCRPLAQKIPMQQELPFLTHTQKSAAAVGYDTKQKKLQFLPTSQKKCLGTGGAMPEVVGLALPDIPSDTNQKSKNVDEHVELITPAHKDVALPDNNISTNTNQKSQGVDQNGSHEELATPKKKDPYLLDTPINKNTKNQSHEEFAFPEQKGTPTYPSQKNEEVVQNGAHNELVRALAMHGYLSSMMDHGGLRNSVVFLNPMDKIPSYFDLMSKFLGLFDNEKAKLKEEFAALRSRICLNAYVWHYDPLSAFLCLSVHYIDNEWERQQKIITFCVLDPFFSAEELSDIILKAIGDWGLCGKVFCIILDDAFTDDSVASNVKAHLQKLNPSCANQSVFVVRYGTHLLDQVIQVGLDELDKIMEKSEQCSNYIKGPAPSAVHYPTTNMHHRKKTGATHGKFVRPCKSFISTWTILTVFVVQFTSLTRHAWHMKRDLDHEAEYHKDGSFSNMIKKMQQKFRKYWKLCCVHLCMPLIMDPSYRLKHIISSHGRYGCYKDDTEDCIRDLHATLLSLFYEYSGQVEDLSCTSGSETSDEIVANEDDMPLGHFYHYGNRYGKVRPMTELDQYLHEPSDSKGRPNVLQWWKKHNLTSVFQKSLVGNGSSMLRVVDFSVARMARDIVAIPYSTDFKVATMTASLAICESGHKHWVEQIVCTQDWLGSDGSASEKSTSDLFD